LLLELNVTVRRHGEARVGFMTNATVDTLRGRLSYKRCHSTEPSEAAISTNI